MNHPTERKTAWHGKSLANGRRKVAGDDDSLQPPKGSLFAYCLQKNCS